MKSTTTYFEQPVLKPPVWKGWIPTYFFTGGIAGGAAALGAAAQLAGSAELAPLIRPARWVATVGTVVSSALLIADLGRPARFLNMLRVFRPTSPMNMGAWILSAAGAGAGASAVLPYLGARGKGAADAAGIAAGVAGLGLCSYTAALLSSTAVPTWIHGARSLPPLFTASAAASTASALAVLRPERRSRALDLLGALGKASELAAGIAYERELERAGARVASHLRTGRAGTLWLASKVLTVGSLGVSLLAGRSRLLRVAGGLLGLAGALALRFAVTESGKSSARDARATFEPQRARLRQPAPRAATSITTKPIKRPTITTAAAAASRTVART